MTETVQNFKDWVLSQAESTDQGSFALSDELRSTSIDVIQGGDYPTRKDEEWRYTPLKDLLGRATKQTALTPVDSNLIARAKDAVADAHHLVFVNNQYSNELSDGFSLKGQQGLSISPLSELDQSSRQKAEQTIGNAKLSDDNIFQHITRGLSRSGLFIDLDKNIEIDQPVHLLFINSDTVSNPINIVHLGDNSRLTIVQQFISFDGSQATTLPADYVELEAGAKLNLYKIGLESSETDHISNVAARLSDSSTFRSHQYLLGSRLSRVNTEVSLNGSNGETVLRGIYLGDNSQHLDVRTYIDHAQPHCSSDQHFRGIMNDQARGVFNGLVLVREHAQKTDAKQSSKNLLLSRDARVDTKPQLEIFADDVKCTHGATIGELDKNALFYLQSRGIGKAEAELMLTRAFAAEVTQDIEIESLKTYIQDQISERLSDVTIAHD